jgi:hypothetical protein
VFVADDGDVGCDVVQTFWLRQMMQALLGTSEVSANQARRASHRRHQSSRPSFRATSCSISKQLRFIDSYHSTRNSYAYQPRVVFSEACPGWLESSVRPNVVQHNVHLPHPRLITREAWTRLHTMPRCIFISQDPSIPRILMPRVPLLSYWATH